MTQDEDPPMGIQEVADDAQAKAERWNFKGDNGGCFFHLPWLPGCCNIMSSTCNIFRTDCTADRPPVGNTQLYVRTDWVGQLLCQAFLMKQRKPAGFFSGRCSDIHLTPPAFGLASASPHTRCERQLRARHGGMIVAWKACAGGMLQAL